jgi:hypothetical protein
MSTLAAIKETDWILGEPGTAIAHHAAQLKDCKAWIVEQHGLQRTPTAHRTGTPGIYEIHAGDHTYWAMEGADTARSVGYHIPRPDTPATYGLADGQAAFIHHPTDGPALVWNRGGNIGRQPVPAAKHSDAEGWAHTKATAMRGLGITTYLGHLEVPT